MNVSYTHLDVYKRQMLGFALSWFMVHLSQSDPAVMTPMTAVWILALPLLDAVAGLIRRIPAGRIRFSTDRQHLHHLLLSYGLSDSWCTAIPVSYTHLDVYKRQQRSVSAVRQR